MELNHEMQTALEEDGQKLLALTGEEHGPEFLGYVQTQDETGVENEDTVVA